MKVVVGDLRIDSPKPIDICRSIEPVIAERASFILYLLTFLSQNLEAFFLNAYRHPIFNENNPSITRTPSRFSFYTVSKIDYLALFPRNSVFSLPKSSIYKPTTRLADRAVHGSRRMRYILVLRALFRVTRHCLTTNLSEAAVLFDTDCTSLLDGKTVMEKAHYYTA